MNNNSLLELPLEVARIIWSDLSLRDVVRFGMTTKNMIEKIWPFYTRISVQLSTKALMLVLSRDLTHVRELDLFYILYPEFNDLPDNIKLIISSIATKKSPNLVKLSIGVRVEGNVDYNNEVTCFNKFIQSQTQLQQLIWYNTYLKPGCDFNIGHFLRDHTRLTELTVETREMFCGIGLLTQLKNLTFSFCDSLDSALFSDVAMNLTQLCSLEFIFLHSIDDSTFMNITKLTNLEQLGMCQNDKIKSSSLTALLKLPKLTNFRLKVSTPWISPESAVPVSIIAQLTNLTTLQISDSSNLDLGQFTTLTNLQRMDISCYVNFVDLSSFQHLTSLTLMAIKPQEFKKIQNLPPNLKKLILAYNFSIPDRDIEVICNLKNLEELQLDGSHNSDMVANWSSQITRLTKLTLLRVMPYAPKELIVALKKLPNLANLTLRRVPDEIIDDLAKLTQLLSLTSWGDNVKDLQPKLPFKVYK